MILAATNVTFAQSAFVPIAIGFFGLGTGYLIYGPQELFGFPKRTARDSATWVSGRSGSSTWAPGCGSCTSPSPLSSTPPTGSICGCERRSACEDAHWSSAPTGRSRC
jgi:hypothetical protein